MRLKTMRIILIDKETKAETTLKGNISEEEAERFCEMWGWNYCNEQGKSYWLGIKE